MRAELVDQVRTLLTQAGFAVSEVFRQRPISFDFLARRDDQLYILKVLTNIDSLSEDVAREMRVLSHFLDGRPLLIGLKASAGPLEAGAVYVRHGIPILSAEGLADYILAGAPPVAFAAPGGFCVRLDGERISMLRAERGLSLGQLADVAGVSRRAISMYEAGMSATVEAALRLEEYLDEPLIVPLDPFARLDPAEPEPPRVPVDQAGDPFVHTVLELLTGLGVGVVPTRRSPFHAIGLLDPARPDAGPPGDALLVSASAGLDVVRKRRGLLSSVSLISERTSVFFTASEGPGLEGATVIHRRELKDVEDAGGLAELVKAKRDEA